MDAKLARVIAQIEDDKIIAADALAKKLGVSGRTIRSYVSQINEILLPAAHVDMVRGRGYQLTVEDQATFDAVMRRSELAQSALPQTPSGRVEYLLNDLLNRTDWVTAETLASVLFVSRFTISDDLKTVEAVLAKFGLTLERRSHRGIRVSGSEFARRICLANLALGKNAAMQFSNWSEMQETIDTVATCVERALTDHALQINSMAYQNLLVHIAVAVARMAECHAVPMDADQLARIQGNAAYPAAEQIAQLVGEAFGIDFPVEEIAYIAIHLAGKQSLYDNDAEGDQTVISDEVWNLAGAMIDHVNEELSFDFRDDLELRVNLAKHIAPLAVRLTYRMQMKNPLLSDIKSRFPLAYSMACEASTVLADSYGQLLSDDEVGYIALAFALALERRKSGEVEKKRILIVCASGAGSARLLEHRYREAFGASVEHIETCDVQGIDAIDLSRIDCVFTTVPLSRELPVPVLEVSAFLDEADIPRVRQALQDSNRTSASAGFFDAQLFFPHLVFDTRDAALEFLSAQVAQHCGIDEDVFALTLEREGLASTAFGNRVAMPHPVRPVARESTVAVGILDRPVDWDGREVQVVFLVCIKPKDKTLKPLYYSLSHLMGSEEDINTLISQQRFETLLELLQATDSK